MLEPDKYVFSTHLRVENPRVILQVPRGVRQRARSLVHHWLVPEGEVRSGQRLLKFFVALLVFTSRWSPEDVLLPAHCIAFIYSLLRVRGRGRPDEGIGVVVGFVL